MARGGAHQPFCPGFKPGGLHSIFSDLKNALKYNMQIYKMGQSRGWPGGRGAAVCTVSAKFNSHQIYFTQLEKLGTSRTEGAAHLPVSNQTSYDVRVTCTDSTAGVCLSGTDASGASVGALCQKAYT